MYASTRSTPSTAGRCVPEYTPCACTPLSCKVTRLVFSPMKSLGENAEKPHCRAKNQRFRHHRSRQSQNQNNLAQNSVLQNRILTAFRGQREGASRRVHGWKKSPFRCIFEPQTVHIFCKNSPRPCSILY